MATILSFRASERSVPKAPMTRTTEATAEIVFFPGIRYERWTEEPKPVKKSRRRRDRLKLDD